MSGRGAVVSLTFRTTRGGARNSGVRVCRFFGFDPFAKPPPAITVSLAPDIGQNF